MLTLFLRITKLSAAKLQNEKKQIVYLNIVDIAKKLKDVGHHPVR